MVGYRIRRFRDDGFIIAMAAFIGALNICKLKLTYVQEDDTKTIWCYFCDNNNKFVFIIKSVTAFF